METFSKDEAISLIKAAIDAKAITLVGSSFIPNVPTTSQTAASRDGMYLTALLTVLTTGKLP